MTRSRKDFQSEILAFMEVVKQSSDKADKLLEAGERYKKEIVDRSLERDGWPKPPPEGSAYRDLIFDLLTAQSAKEEVPAAVAKALAVQATINFLQASNFPSALIKPLRDLVGDMMDIARAERLQGEPGRRPMPHNDATKAAFAAATVTLLGGKEDALKMVCKAQGFELKWLRQFRQNLLRGKGGDALLHYKFALLMLKNAPEEMVLGLLK